jgi:hypothetical protein
MFQTSFISFGDKYFIKSTPLLISIKLLPYISLLTSTIRPISVYQFFLNKITHFGKVSILLDNNNLSIIFFHSSIQIVFLKSTVLFSHISVNLLLNSSTQSLTTTFSGLFLSSSQTEFTSSSVGS